jgi:hypothetical protein
VSIAGHRGAVDEAHRGGVAEQGGISMGRVMRLGCAGSILGAGGEISGIGLAGRFRPHAEPDAGQELSGHQYLGAHLGLKPQL